MITLATAAYAHHNDVNAYRFTSITTSSIARFAGVPSVAEIAQAPPKSCGFLDRRSH